LRKQARRQSPRSAIFHGERDEQFSTGPNRLDVE
jgi:hypothetical protein